MRCMLKIKAKKVISVCQNCVLLFLDHTISNEGIATDPDKVIAVREWPMLVDQTEVRSSLGLCGYYRQFIKENSEMAKPLHRLTEKGREYIWNEECQRSHCGYIAF